MFRSAPPPNPLESVVDKATDSNLTTENWEYILDACDKVNEDPEDGAKNAVNAVLKRLAVSNANVQLYSLTLLTSMAQNCGSKMYREIASKLVTDTLLRMAKDRNVHKTVKTKIAETMEALTKEFQGDPSLKLMAEAHQRLLKEIPTIQAPAVPQKHQMTDLDRQKEEEELQMVLALSLSEVQPGRQFNQPSTEQNSQASQPGQVGLTGQPQPTQAPQGTTAATVTRVRALYDLNSTEEGELSFRKGDIIHVIESVYRDWWRGSLRGEIGIFPLNYVVPEPEPTVEELQREAEEEMRVFAQSQNIEKLLAILSSANQRDSMVIAENDELQNMYHSTLQVRPKLVKLIDKYAQKKDDLIQLNEKFVNARRIYDQLMEASLAHYKTSSRNPSYAPGPYSEAPPYPLDLPNPAQHQYGANPFNRTAPGPQAPQGYQGPPQHQQAPPQHQQAPQAQHPQAQHQPPAPAPAVSYATAYVPGAPTPPQPLQAIPPQASAPQPPAAQGAPQGIHRQASPVQAVDHRQSVSSQPGGYGQPAAYGQPHNPYAARDQAPSAPPSAPSAPPAPSAFPAASAPALSQSPQSMRAYAQSPQAPYGQPAGDFQGPSAPPSAPSSAPPAPYAGQPQQPQQPYGQPAYAANYYS